MYLYEFIHNFFYYIILYPLFPSMDEMENRATNLMLFVLNEIISADLYVYEDVCECREYENEMGIINKL